VVAQITPGDSSLVHAKILSASQHKLVLCEFFHIRIMKPWGYVQLGMGNILFQQISRKNLWINWPGRGLIFLRLAIGPPIYISTLGL